MKKAKFALAAIAVLGVVGGAFAFKANRSFNYVYVPTTTLPTTLCISKVPGFTLTTTTTLPTTLATTISTLPCAVTRITEGQ